MGVGFKWVNMVGKEASYEKSQAMCNDGAPWRGAREKHHVFFSILLATLTIKNNVSIDWQCGVGTLSLSTSSLL
jgi:hypothetical protein